MKQFFIISFHLYCITTFAQWECRSNLTGHLKPFVQNRNLQWATEINGSAGVLNSNTITNGMGFLGLDYTSNNHQIHFEGGFKTWYQHDSELEPGLTKSLFGLREVSYNYFSPTLDISLGLQQMQMANFVVLNERAWGASVDKKIGGLQIQFDAATVTKDFARNGTFCSNCFIYDIVPSRNNPLGNNWGETNFAAISFNKKIGEKILATPDTQDEFSEFGEFETVENNIGSPALSLKSFGGLVYSEFGSYYNQPQTYIGVTSDIDLWNFATIKPEVIYQAAQQNNAILLIIRGEKTIDYTSGNTTSIQAGYLGKINIDNNAVAALRFSNLFMGEVLRMDMIDVPLINLSARHRFVDSKMSVKLNYTKQLKAQQMEELNLSLGKYYFNKHIRTTLITGIANSNELKKRATLCKLELRMFF